MLSCLHARHMPVCAAEQQRLRRLVSHSPVKQSKRLACRGRAEEKEAEAFRLDGLRRGGRRRRRGRGGRRGPLPRLRRPIRHDWCARARSQVRAATRDRAQTACLHSEVATYAQRSCRRANPQLLPVRPFSHALSSRQALVPVHPFFRRRAWRDDARRAIRPPTQAGRPLGQIGRTRARQMGLHQILVAGRTVAAHRWRSAIHQGGPHQEALESRWDAADATRLCSHNSKRK